MNKKHGFTLAEVLITLVIIGVIAAMTVPTLMQSTGSQEYRSAFKKAVAMLNQAVTMNYALTGNDAETLGTQTSAVNMFSDRLSVLKSEAAAGTFTTADGMAFTVTKGFSDSVSCTNTAKTGCGAITVDVNGTKGPNISTTDPVNAPKDRYTVYLMSNRVVPDDIGSQIMYDAK